MAWGREAAREMLLGIEFPDEARDRSDWRMGSAAVGGSEACGAPRCVLVRDRRLRRHFRPERLARVEQIFREPD